jgi:hypothetical protein
VFANSCRNSPEKNFFRPSTIPSSPRGTELNVVAEVEAGRSETEEEEEEKEEGQGPFKSSE